MASNKKYGRIVAEESAKEAKPAVVATAVATGTTALARLPGISLPTGFLTKSAEWLFYGSVIALILFLLLVFLHYTTYPIFSFGSSEEGIIPLPSAANSQQAFLSGPAASDRTANFTDLRAFAASYAMTLKLDGSVLGTAPRVLFYRAAAATPAPTSAAGLATAYPNSNVILYLDPLVNDIYLYVKTATDSATKLVVRNAPIGSPFRITLVIQPKYVEVYRDGLLMETVLTPSGADLMDIAPTYNVWGPPATTGTSARLAYLTYWPYVLTPKLVRIDAAKSRDMTILS